MIIVYNTQQIIVQKLKKKMLIKQDSPKLLIIRNKNKNEKLENVVIVP